MVLTKKLESYGDCRNKGYGLVLRTVTSGVGEMAIGFTHSNLISI